MRLVMVLLWHDGNSEVVEVADVYGSAAQDFDLARAEPNPEDTVPIDAQARADVYVPRTLYSLLVCYHTETACESRKSLSSLTGPFLLYRRKNCPYSRMVLHHGYKHVAAA